MSVTSHWERMLEVEDVRPYLDPLSTFLIQGPVEERPQGVLADSEVLVHWRQNPGAQRDASGRSGTRDAPCPVASPNDGLEV